MEADAAVIEEVGFKDRKVRLMVFGGLQIILGCFSALAVASMIAGTFLSRTFGNGAAEGVSLKTMIPAILVYVLAAVWFVSMGFGSVQARRWARALVLVTSWLWLICGTMGFVMMLLLIPRITGYMEQNDNLPKEAAVVVRVVMMVTLAVIYVVIPGLLVLFYSGKNVKATCEHWDRRVRWTDKCPLPVLGASIICVGWGIGLLSLGMHGWVIAFFGIVLNGIPGAIMVLVLVALLGYAVWGLYKLDNKAWWIAVLMIAGWAVSCFVTWSSGNMQLLYEKMNLPTQQLSRAKQYSFFLNPAMKWFIVLWATVLVGYFVFIKKYFDGGQDELKEPESNDY